MGIGRKVDGVWLVRDEIDFNRHDLEGTIEQVIVNLKLMKEKAISLGMIGDGCIDMDVDHYGNGITIHYYFERCENDKERSLREKVDASEKDRKAKERKRAAEKRKMKTDDEFAEYERLRAKFEV